MTTAVPIARPLIAPERQPQPPVRERVEAAPSFAAHLEPIANPLSDDFGSTSSATRFDEVSIFGVGRQTSSHRHPRATTNFIDEPLDPRPGTKLRSTVDADTWASTKAPRLKFHLSSTIGNDTAPKPAVSPKASHLASYPAIGITRGAASGSEGQSVTQASATNTRTRVLPRAHASAVFVSVHASDAQVSVFARAGRMAPTERTKLRNAIGALLAEHGHHDIAVTLADGGGWTWRK